MKVSTPLQKALLLWSSKRLYPQAKAKRPKRKKLLLQSQYQGRNQSSQLATKQNVSHLQSEATETSSSLASTVRVRSQNDHRSKAANLRKRLHFHRLKLYLIGKSLWSKGPRRKVSVRDLNSLNSQGWALPLQTKRHSSQAQGIHHHRTP